MQSQKYYLIGLVLHFAKIKQKLIVTKFNLDIFIKIKKKNGQVILYIIAFIIFQLLGLMSKNFVRKISDFYNLYKNLFEYSKMQ